MLRANPLSPVCLNSGAGFVANLAAGEHFLHGRPIRLDPPAIVPAVSVGRHVDLREAQQ